MAAKDFLAEDIVQNVTNAKANYPRDFLAEDIPYQPRNFLDALIGAPEIIGEDLLKGAVSLGKNIPDYLKKGTEEIGWLPLTAANKPVHLAKQGLAGLAEAGQNIFNLPHDISNYLSERLKLLPQNINEKIQMGRMPDTSESINKLFGEPEYPGEQLARGVVRNFPMFPATETGLGAASKASELVRPGKVAKNFAEKNIQELQNVYAKAIKEQKLAYDQFFNKYGQSKITPGSNNYLSLTKKEIKNLGPTAEKLLGEFETNPNTQNLHNFQSQVGKDSVKVKDEYVKQILRNIQNRAQGNLINYAKSLGDPKALSGLEEGIRLTRDVVKPFETTPTMKKIVKKNIEPGERSFKNIESAVQKATESGENILDPMTGDIKARIKGVPENHYLRQIQRILQDQKNVIERRKLYRNIALGGVVGIPALRGAYDIYDYLKHKIIP